MPASDEPPGLLATLKVGYLFSMRRWSDYAGRSERWEFWSFVAGYFLLSVAASILDAVTSLFIEDFRVFDVLVRLVHALPNLALLARRMHDIDRRAWFMLWPPTAIKGLYRAGTPGPNRFGPEPEAPDRRHARGREPLVIQEERGADRPDA